MKYSLSEYAIDAEYEHKLRNKKSIFIDTPKTRKAVRLTMVTTFGIKTNAHSGIVQNEVKLDDLFA